MRMLLTIGIAWSVFNHFNYMTLLSAQASKPSIQRLKCPPNTYIDRNRNRCAVCTKCDNYSIKLKACGKRKDTVCLNCSGEDSIQRPSCRKCPPCPEGQFVSTPCSRKNATQCRTCPEGSYNPKTSYSNVCTPCTSCYRQNKVEASPCDDRSDSICGHCKKGYYLKPRSSICIPCPYCLGPNERWVEKCQMDGVGGKSCEQIKTHVFSHRIEESWAEEWEEEDITIIVELPQSSVDQNTKSTFNNNIAVSSTVSILSHTTTGQPDNMLEMLLSNKGVLAFWIILLVFLCALFVFSQTCRSNSMDCIKNNCQGTGNTGKKYYDKLRHRCPFNLRISSKNLLTAQSGNIL